MKLVITEKPSAAKSIASALGVTSRADGYFEGNGYLISWCIGHLEGLADAAAYDDRYKKWRYECYETIRYPWLCQRKILEIATKIPWSGQAKIPGKGKARQYAKIPPGKTGRGRKEWQSA